MKRKDFIVILVTLLIITPFIFFTKPYQLFEHFTKEYGFLSAFVKFAILATFGESIALRIKEGQYNKPNFGLIPRAVVWGGLGIAIKIAFGIFAKGTPEVLSHIVDLKNISNPMLADIIRAFAISLAMNTIFAPVMMTLHKITDAHIVQHEGKLNCLTKKIKVTQILQNLNWQVHWNFVLKKTIPFFWIPAHTITFILPNELRVLFAAILGILLGLILAFATNKK